MLSVSTFANCDELTVLDLSNVTINLNYPINDSSQFTNTVNGCSKLQTLYLPTIVNGYDYIRWTSTFKGAPLLENIYGIPDIYATKAAYLCDMRGSSSISRDTMLTIFNNVSNAVGGSDHMYIDIDSAVNARLSAADKAIFTGKGHTIFVD